MFRTLRFYHSFFKFLSTPSSRRATGAARHHATVPTYFYPRPPRGGRPDIPVSFRCMSGYFYPRPPRGGRLVVRPHFTGYVNFYPRPPRGGRHVRIACALLFCRFLSTPSARRATVWLFCLLLGLRHFYPRPPRGGRHIICCDKRRFVLFLSTPSARRATDKHQRSEHVRENFYPRPPRGGRPGFGCCLLDPIRHFYPRPPRGGRLWTETTRCTMV